MRNSSFIRAVAVALIAILLFDIQGAIIKILASHYSIPQIATFRNIFGLIPSLILVYLTGTGSVTRGSARFRLRQWPLAILRGALLAGAQFCLYLSLSLMDFAIATTLVYAGPLFITILSVPLLHHRIGVIRWLAVVIGFIGIILIMRPQGDIFQWVSILPICAAFFYAFSSVLVRLFDDNSPTAVINLHTNISTLVFTVLMMIITASYIPISNMTDWMWMLLMGIVGGMAVFSLITAYRLTLPSNLSPFEYFGILFAFVIGWLVFDEAPFDRLVPGVFLIVGGGLLIFWRERYIAE